MTTDTSKASKGLIKDLKSIPSPMFYIFAAVAVFAGLFVLGITPYGVTATIFLLLLVACASADIKNGIIPDLIVIWIAVLAVINLIVIDAFSVESIVDRLIGAVCVSVPMLIASLILKGAFGGGDIKLTAAAGLFLGWKAVIAGAVVGLFFAGLYSVILLLIKKLKFRSKIRLAPFLVFGFSYATLFGNLLISMLFNW